MSSSVKFIQHQRRGPFHFICLPGLVPDGPETFLRQRSLLHKHGTVSIATWPHAKFDLDTVLEGIGRRIEDAANSHQKPVVMAVSFGGSIYLELLRRAKAAGQVLPVAANLLISPMPGPKDLSPLLARLVKPISEQAGLDDAHARVALERGRSFFRMLAAKSAGVETTELRWNTFLTPTGIRRYQEGRIRGRIEATLASIPTDGAIERICALTSLQGIDERTGVLSDAPTLILWGSREGHTLNMEGPGTSLLSRPDLAARIFPNTEVQFIYDRDGEVVPHASLLKHAKAFNPMLQRFLIRQHRRLHAHRFLRLPFLDKLGEKAKAAEIRAHVG